MNFVEHRASDVCNVRHPKDLSINLQGEGQPVKQFELVSDQVYILEKLFRWEDQSAEDSV